MRKVNRMFPDKRIARSFLIILLLQIFLLQAQEMTRWNINVRVPAGTPEDASIYIAGNFNHWDPGNAEYELNQRKDGKYHLDLLLPADTVEFKFTLGSWHEVEVELNGNDIENRNEDISGKDLKSTYRIKAWKTPGSKVDIVGDVRVIEDFKIPQLNRSRRIWIYLPPGYDKSNERYPVLYMQDGQNLFSDSTSFSGEWEVDEILEKMIRRKRLRGIIVVGIDNGGDQRLSEYSPKNFEYSGITIPAKAPQYAEFIVHTLKPYIDSAYRTLPDRENTAIAGSSMGGLVSVYIGVCYQEIFSKVGALSSSFSICPDEIVQVIRDNPKAYPMRIWLDMGAKELGRMDKEANQLLVLNALIEAGWHKGREVSYKVIPRAGHNEPDWSRRFHKVLRYLFK